MGTSGSAPVIISFALLRDARIRVLWHTLIARRVPRVGAAAARVASHERRRGRGAGTGTAEAARVAPCWTPAVDGVPASPGPRIRPVSGFATGAAPPRLKSPFLQFRPSGNVEDHYRSRGIRHTARYLRAGGPLAHIECLIEADLRRARRP